MQKRQYVLLFLHVPLHHCAYWVQDMTAEMGFSYQRTRRTEDLGVLFCSIIQSARQRILHAPQLTFAFRICEHGMHYLLTRLAGAMLGIW
jgi:hypothetical protein